MRAPAAGLEPALSRLTVARLTDSTTPERVEPPRPASPPVFETGYRAGGSPSVSGPGRRRTCNPPLKRRQLCQLSYGAVSVTGRDRTCDAPRFRRALYRAELRSREMGGAGVETAASSVSEDLSTQSKVVAWRCLRPT